MQLDEWSMRKELFVAVNFYSAVRFLSLFATNFLNVSLSSVYHEVFSVTAVIHPHG